MDLSVYSELKFFCFFLRESESGLSDIRAERGS